MINTREKLIEVLKNHKSIEFHVDGKNNVEPHSINIKLILDLLGEQKKEIQVDQEQIEALISASLESFGVMPGIEKALQDATKKVEKTESE